MIKHRIQSVDARSIGAALGVEAGDYLLRINGEPIEDVIDYESLTTEENLLLSMETASGEPYEAEVEKDAYEPLGFNFESSLMSKLRPCKNHCVFCFIDQLPKGGRETLHVKDDDWRLSLIMGNYITLTNVDEAEFERMIKRRVSPLYISVHATNGEVRKRMMNNPTADKLVERLTRLKREGLRFDAQIVLCPGLNDGDVLADTLDTLYDLQPAAQSVAVVPVGLTKFRDGLYPLRTLSEQDARAAIGQIEAVEAKSKAAFGTSFAYASDEMYLIAKQPLPPYDAYEDFLQIENGVGLLRAFEYGFHEALLEQKPLTRRVAVDTASGVSAAPFLDALFKELNAYGIDTVTHAVINRHFGESITVSGLITGEDILSQLKGKLRGKALLLPVTMMRENDTAFLDGMTLTSLSQALGSTIWPMPAADGAQFIEKLFAYLQQ